MINDCIIIHNPPECISNTGIRVIRNMKNKPSDQIIDCVKTRIAIDIVFMHHKIKTDHVKVIHYY